MLLIGLDDDGDDDDGDGNTPKHVVG